MEKSEMQLSKVLFSLTLMLLVAANCVAQDDAKAAKKKKAMDRAVANATKQIMKSFGKVELTEEQQTKAKEIVTTHIAKLQEAKKAQDGLLSDDQKAKRKEGIAAAKEEGVKGNKVWAAGVKAMGLNEEEQKAYDAAKKKVNEVNAAIKKEVMGLLTDEQKAALPKKGKKGGKKKMKKGDDAEEGDGKTQTVSLKLPGMT
jgi:hypothetical protein